MDSDSLLIGFIFIPLAICKKDGMFLIDMVK
jgi:hypothetical protein